MPLALVESRVVQSFSFGTGGDGRAPRCAILIAHMSQKEIPFDSFEFLAQSVRKLLADAGPLSSKEIVRQLRREGSPMLQPSAVRKVLDQTMADEVHRLPGNVYGLIDTSE